MLFSHLPFRNDVVEFAVYAKRAMVNKGDQASWELLMSTLKPETYSQILDFVKNNHEELKKNPLIMGILKLYTIAYEQRDIEAIEKAHEKYYELQEQYSFNDNMKMFMEAGCSFWTDKETLTMHLVYPIFLYRSHLKDGGDPDHDTRFGFLFPTRQFTIDEIKQLKKECPEFLKKNKTISKMVNKIMIKKRFKLF